MEEFTLESPLTGFTLAEDLENLTLPEYLLQKAKLWSETGKTKFIIDAVTEEFNDFCSFEEKTRKLASALYKQGMRQYDTAIYMTLDLVNLHFFFGGVWRANGAVRASYPEDDENTLLSRVEESRVGWILCDPNTAEMCLSVAEKIYWGVQVIVVGEFDGCVSLNSLFEDEGDETPPLLITSSSIAMILCTSGTTGKSKGAVHTHKSLLNMIDGASLFLPFTEHKPNLLVSKGTHITGSLFPLAAFAVGKTAIVMANISKENLFKAVDSFKPGMVWGFPTFLLALVNDSDAKDYDFSSIEIAASGGAPVTPAFEAALTALPNLKFVMNAYGLTEIVPISVSINYENGTQEKYPDSPPFSSGKIFPGVSVQIRDLNNGQSLGPNQRGEICTKSVYLFQGYYKNELATNEAIVGGWFKTGDVGYYDKNGFLFVQDRIKEIFKYYNNHISPTELEDVIGQHPSVAESCVIGVVDPDGGGSIPRAFVKLKDGNHCEPDELFKFANGRLPDYKNLRGGVYILEELPKGKTGKITRQLVEKLEVVAEE